MKVSEFTSKFKSATVASVALASVLALSAQDVDAKEHEKRPRRERRTHQPQPQPQPPQQLPGDMTQNQTVNLNGKQYTVVDQNTLVDVDGRQYTFNHVEGSNPTLTVKDSGNSSIRDSGNSRVENAGNSSITGSGNSRSRSEIQDSGNVTESGNSDVDITDNSVFQAGEATNLYAAGVQAVKDCVPSTAFGFVAGGVFANYAGVNFSRVPSGAVAISGKDKNGEDIYLTVPELAALTPQERPEALKDLKDKQKELAMCLAGAFDAAIKLQAASLDTNGKYQVMVAQIEAYAEVRTKEIDANMQLGLATLPHVCADTENMTNEIPVSVARGSTAPGQENTEHYNCVETLKDSKEEIRKPIQIPTFEGIEIKSWSTPSPSAQ